MVALKNHISWFQNILQNNGNTNSMVLSWKLTQLPIGQYGKHRNKPTHLDLEQVYQNHTMGTSTNFTK